MAEMQHGTSAAQKPRWRRALDRGAGLVEYALLVALIAVACLVAVDALGSGNEGSINDTASSVASAMG